MKETSYDESYKTKNWDYLYFNCCLRLPERLPAS